MNLTFWNNLAKKNKTTGYSDLSYAAFDQSMRLLCLKKILNQHINAEACRVLSLFDYGCGNGDFLYHFAPCFNHLTGYDVSPEIIKVAQIKLKNKPNVVLTDQLESITGRFDVIISITVLQHILDDPSLSETLNAIRSKASGKALFICLESVEEDQFKPAIPSHLKPRRIERWIEIFSQCGFVFKSSHNFYNPSLIPTSSYQTYRKKTKIMRGLYKLFSRAGIHLHFFRYYFNKKSIRLLSNPDRIDGLIQTESFSKFMVFEARNNPRND